MTEFILNKPTIDSNKILTEQEAQQVETALKRSGAMLIHLNAEVAKNDYVNDYDRGTVKFADDMRNYSFHKVIIPDGTVVKECNFTQLKKNTEAITGKNLTFIECNLKNNVIDASWTLERCNTTQEDLVFEAPTEGVE